MRSLRKSIKMGGKIVEKFDIGNKSATHVQILRKDHD